MSVVYQRPRDTELPKALLSRRFLPGDAFALRGGLPPACNLPGEPCILGGDLRLARAPMGEMPACLLVKVAWPVVLGVALIS